MHDREYDRLKKQIEEEYRANLDALERIWRMSKKQGGSAPSNGKRGSLLGAARQAVAEKHGTFNLRDIEDSIKRHNPDLTVRRPSLSSTLLRLVEDGDLEVVEKGIGRKGSTYKTKTKAG
jgi:hypothetical protein